jgi:hypothetical protein
VKFYHFIPDNNGWDESVPNPNVAKHFIPDWYKRAEITYASKDGKQQSGLKTCAPFLDALISGYMLVTWTDVHVKILPDGRVDIDWDANTSGPQFAERESASGATMPRPAGHLPNHLAWAPKWGIKSPKGFSTLITHPLNRFDLPFTTSSGIMDSDKLHVSGNIPFFLKEGFEGVIPKGTPFAQVIPIKRESWTAVYDPALIGVISETGMRLRGVERGYYRDNYWVKKIYNLATSKNRNNHEE